MLNMTPMIDVVFQLIIFFMYTSQFAQMSRTPINLPEEAGESGETADPSALVIDVRGDGSFVVDGQDVDLDRLARMVLVEINKAKDDAAGLDVLIRADRTCPSAHINAIARELADIGVRSWKLGTIDPTRGAGSEPTK